MLRAKGACADQLAIFEREWPDGCAVTLDDCHRAVALGLDLNWAAENLLPATAWNAYADAVATAFHAAAKGGAA